MSWTASLALATLAFVGTHLLMSHPLRAGMVGRLGERGFLIVYSLVSAVTLGWVIVAWRSIEPGEPLWIAPLWWWDVAAAILYVALVLLVGSFVRNPAFPHPGAEAKAPPEARGAFAITRHPMNWSFMLWAAAHISLFGSARNLIVASGILILALFGSIGQDGKKRRLLGDIWRDWEARTSFVPFAALVEGRASWRAVAPIWIAMLIAALLWVAITFYHAPMVSPLAWLQPGFD